MLSWTGHNPTPPQKDNEIIEVRRFRQDKGPCRFGFDRKHMYRQCYVEGDSCVLFLLNVLHGPRQSLHDRRLSWT